MSNATRAQLIHWMERVLRFNDWTAATWCKNAGISPTVVTRFMKNPDAPVPSTISIYKLSEVVGFGPDFVTKNTVPLLVTCSEVLLWVEKKSTPASTTFIHAGDVVSLGTFALKARSLNVLNRGITSGSTIIVDSERKPELGDVVVAMRSGSGAPGEDEMELFVYKPPYLEPSTPAGPPVTWPLKGAEIAGVVTRLIVDLVQEREQASEPTPSQ